VRCLFWAIALFIVATVVLPALVAVTAMTTFAAFWVLRSMLPWLLVGLGIWLVVGRGHRSRRDRWHHRNRWYSDQNGWGSSPEQEWTRPAPPAPPAEPEKASPLVASLPIDVEVKVEQIQHKVTILLGYAERFPIFSQDLFLVRQTADEYLPKTLDAYQAIAASGGSELETASGKTAHQELNEQLDLLDSKLSEIAQDLQRRDVDHLLANRRFLEERFGHRSGG
jgi:hypothetical protein